MFRHIVKKCIGANKKNTEQVAGEHATRTASVYETPDDALKATSEFYENQKGFQYTEQKVTDWIRKHVQLPRTGRVLDLCCGDGIWSKGIKNCNPALELYGIDAAQGGITKARKLLKTDERHLVVGDAEAGLPFEDGFFHLIFARGPCLYNQHDMDRPSTISVIEAWHEKLAQTGVFYSIFASTPGKMGTYTPMEEAKLPYNRAPRKTETIDFLGGKYHHTIQSFLAPFWKARNVEMIAIRFENVHVLVTRLAKNKGKICGHLIMKFSKRIIIGGLPRSGTTLFRYVLDASSRIICGPETSFFLRPLTEQRKRAHRVAARVNRALEIGEDVIIEALARARRSVECFDAVMTIYQQTAGESKDIWAEKSPRNCLSYEWLYDEEPEIYFVSLIRDGRDVVTSIVEGSDEYHVTIDRMSSRWRPSIGFKRGRHLVVRYEDLVYS